MSHIKSSLRLSDVLIKIASLVTSRYNRHLFSLKLVLQCGAPKIAKFVYYNYVQ